MNKDIIQECKFNRLYVHLIKKIHGALLHVHTESHWCKVKIILSGGGHQIFIWQLPHNLYDSRH